MASGRPDVNPLLRRATILRWTGSGSLADLQSSVEHIMGLEGLKGKAKRSGNSLVVAGPEPARTCSVFRHLPGVSWLAAGYAVEGSFGLAAAAEELAKRYLRRGGRFGVEAESAGGPAASDIAGAVTSHLLDAAKGARASPQPPRTTFRVAVDASGGAAGVELSRGPGGIPTGRDRASCLVSGGKHSSVMAWQAVLMGYRVRLVHAVEDDEGLLAAARLYSELSFRSDPRGLSLTAIEGGPAARLLRGFASEADGPVFCGLTAKKALADWPPESGVTMPLYLLSEEWFDSEFRGLDLEARESALGWGKGGTTKARSKSFGGRRADVSEVLDGLS